MDDVESTSFSETPYALDFCLGAWLRSYYSHVVLEKPNPNKLGETRDIIRILLRSKK